MKSKARMKSKAKKKLVNFDRKILDDVPSNNDSEIGVEPFLNEAAPTIEQCFPEYTGSFTLHIRNGKLASWESKAGGRYKR